MIMTDLETFAKATIDRGGEWYTLQSSGRYCLCECKTMHWKMNARYFESPTFQIFRDGARIFVSLNYREAYEKFERMVNNAT